MTAAVVLLLALSGICLTIHLASAWLCLMRSHWPCRSGGLIGLPPVSLLRPVRGYETFDAATLASSFLQDYPDYEIVFCVESEQDPAAALVRRLIATHPEVPARLLVGASTISGNPKLNNLWKGWRGARHDWICMADSNLMLPPEYLRQVVGAWDAETGLVSGPPVGIWPEGLAGRLECAFLNGNQGRFQFAADSLGLGFAQGKTLFCNRLLVNAAGGFPVLGEELAEDVMATKLMRAMGLRVRLVPQPFAQPIGRRGWREVWARQLRWSRLRRAGFPALFLLEALNGPVVPGLALAGAAALADLTLAEGTAVLAAFAGLWYGAEMRLLTRAGWPCGRADLLAPVLRDLLLPALWVATWLGRDIEWQGRAVAGAAEAGSEAGVDGLETLAP